MIYQNSSLPLYQQISESIAADILNGIYKAGEKLPGELFLCKHLGVSRVTLRHAIADLVDSGLVVSKQGKGTYVSSSKNVSDITRKRFQLRRFYKVPGQSTEIIESGKIVPEKELLSFAGVDEGQQYPYVVRLRYIESKPAIVEVDFFNENSSKAMAYDIASRSLLNVLRDELGIVVDNFDDSFRIIPAGSQIAKVLNVPEGTPLVRIFEVVRDKDDQIVFFSDQIINSEIYKYRIRYGYSE